MERSESWISGAILVSLLLYYGLVLLWFCIYETVEDLVRSLVFVLWECNVSFLLMGLIADRELRFAMPIIYQRKSESPDNECCNRVLSGS